MTALQQPAVRTRITSLFKCRYPIVLPGMSWISTPALVAAVSNAGGVGILATGPLNAEQTRDSIAEIRNLTDQPFAVGATLMMPGAHENAQVAIEERVPILNVSLGKAEGLADACHDYGGILISTVTTAKHAKAAIDSGADALLCTGHEAAAHGGDLTSLVLIPSLAQQFPDTPLIAAGGLAHGHGLASALALGADAVAMGTRFAVTTSSPLSSAAKQAILQASESQTLYGSNFDGIPARVLQTPVSSKLMQSKPSLPTVLYRAFAAAQDFGVPLWQVLPGLLTQFNRLYMLAQFGAATQAIQAATVDGDLTRRGVQFVGQCQGLIHDIPDVDELVQRTVREARETSKKVQITLGEEENESVIEAERSRLG